MKPFNLEAALSGAKVVTRDGREVTEIYLFKNTAIEYPLAAIIDGGVHCFSKSGSDYSNNEESGYDLFMAGTKREGWVNIYSADIDFLGPDVTAGASHIFPTKEIADERSQNGRTACVKIEWEE